MTALDFAGRLAPTIVGLVVSVLVLVLARGNRRRVRQLVSDCQAGRVSAARFAERADELETVGLVLLHLAAVAAVLSLAAAVVSWWAWGG